MYRYFTDAEVAGLDPVFVWFLDKAREEAGVPFVLTSGFRTPEQNEAAGGKSNSAHLRGLAVDIQAKDSHTRFRIVKSLLSVGFTRIFLYVSTGHLHVDMDKTLDQQVMRAY